MAELVIPSVVVESIRLLEDLFEENFPMPHQIDLPKKSETTIVSEIRFYFGRGFLVSAKIETGVDVGEDPIVDRRRWVKLIEATYWLGSRSKTQKRRQVESSLWEIEMVTGKVWREPSTDVTIFTLTEDQIHRLTEFRQWQGFNNIDWCGRD